MADVISLTIDSSGIVESEEMEKEFAVGDDLGIEGDLDNFGMTGDA